MNKGIGDQYMAYPYAAFAIDLYATGVYTQLALPADSNQYCLVLL